MYLACVCTRNQKKLELELEFYLIISFWKKIKKQTVKQRDEKKVKTS